MANSEDVLTIYDEMAQGIRDAHKSDWEDVSEALAAEVRELRGKLAELESDQEWISERCADCGHRFAYPSNYCARCNRKVGPTEPDEYPETCECPRCIVARNVAMDAAMGGGEGEA